MKEMKVLESVFKKLAVPSRCTVRGGTAGACPQSSKPAKEQKVDGRPSRRRWRHTVELMSTRVSLGVARRDSTPREHRQQVHHSAGSLRSCGALLHRWRAQTVPTPTTGRVKNLGARRWIRMGQKAFRHSLGTTFTFFRATRPKGQRFGHRSDGEKAGARARSGKRRVRRRL